MGKQNKEQRFEKVVGKITSHNIVTWFVINIPFWLGFAFGEEEIIIAIFFGIISVVWLICAVIFDLYSSEVYWRKIE